MASNFRQRQTGHLHSYPCCAPAVPSTRALRRRHSGIGERIENPGDDTGHHAGTLENRYGTKPGFWHMQYVSAVAAVAKVLLQTLIFYVKISERLFF